MGRAHRSAAGYPHLRWPWRRRRRSTRLARHPRHRRRLHHFRRQHHGPHAHAHGPPRTLLRARPPHDHPFSRRRSCRRHSHRCPTRPLSLRWRFSAYRIHNRPRALAAHPHRAARLEAFSDFPEPHRKNMQRRNRTPFRPHALHGNRCPNGGHRPFPRSRRVSCRPIPRQLGIHPQTCPPNSIHPRYLRRLFLHHHRYAARSHRVDRKLETRPSADSTGYRRKICRVGRRRSPVPLLHANFFSRRRRPDANRRIFLHPRASLQTSRPHLHAALSRHPGSLAHHHPHQRHPLQIPKTRPSATCNRVNCFGVRRLAAALRSQPHHPSFTRLAFPPHSV